MLTGARSFTAIGEFSQQLPQATLAWLGIWQRPYSNWYVAPSETTLRCVLQQLDADELDRVVGGWLADQYQPLSVEKQVVIIFAGTQGLLDDLPVDAVREFETFFYAWLERRSPQILTEIRDRKELPDAARDALAAAVTEAKTEFTAAKGIKAA